MQTQNIIISADDFGVSAKANRAILELAKSGKLDRVSVMIGGILPENEVRELLNSGVKIDIHLHLFSPDFFRKRGKEASRGIIKRVFYFGANFLIGRYRAKKIKSTWENQIEDFRRIFGGYPDGLNSHEHIHFFPPFFNVALELAEKFSISYIRLGKKSNGNNNAVGFILDILRKFNLRRKNASFSTSDNLTSFDWLKNPDLKKITSGTEIVFHPERDNEYKFLAGLI